MVKETGKKSARRLLHQAELACRHNIVQKRLNCTNQDFIDCDDTVSVSLKTTKM